MQVTNEGGGWSTVPFNDENLRQLGILFPIRSLLVVESVLRAGSIPSSLTSLNMSGSGVSGGRLGDVLSRSSGLEVLSLRGTEPISISSLPQSLSLFEMEDLRLDHAPGVILPRLHHLRLKGGTRLDPLLIPNFGAIFPSLRSILIHAQNYGLLKASLRRIPSLQWINLLGPPPLASLRQETEWDTLILRQTPKNRTGLIITTLIKEGNWKILPYP